MPNCFVCGKEKTTHSHLPYYFCGKECLNKWSELPETKEKYNKKCVCSHIELEHCNHVDWEWGRSSICRRCNTCGCASFTGAKKEDKCYCSLCKKKIKDLVFYHAGLPYHLDCLHKQKGD